MGCPRMCAVSCECCVVIVCLFDRQDNCVTGLLVLVCPRPHHYNTATPCTPHILGQPNSSCHVKKMSWQMSKHSMTTQHTQVTAHILGHLNISSPIKKCPGERSRTTLLHSTHRGSDFFFYMYIQYD